MISSNHLQNTVHLFIIEQLELRETLQWLELLHETKVYDIKCVNFTTSKRIIPTEGALPYYSADTGVFVLIVCKTKRLPKPHTYMNEVHERRRSREE